MYRELEKHKWAYAFLSLGLVVLTLAFMAVWPDHLLQRLIVVAMGIFYFIWGILTHVKAEHISRRVILEYFGISALASLLLLLITF
jgi:hypothetical protein